MSKQLFISLFFMLVLVSPVLSQRRMKQMDSDKQAQEDEVKSYEQQSWKDKMVYGGNFWLAFGSASSMVYLQPLVGYKVTENFTAGGGFTYIYWKQQYFFSNNQTITLTDNIYGLNMFARHNLFGPIFAYAEYQPMNFTSYNYLQESKRIWSNSLFLGGGINQSFGKSGSGAYILLLYDVLWSERDQTNPRAFDKSFRPSPFDIRFGLFF
jgi:hypothetical protein